MFNVVTKNRGVGMELVTSHLSCKSLIIETKDCPQCLAWWKINCCKNPRISFFKVIRVARTSCHYETETNPYAGLLLAQSNYLGMLKFYIIEFDWVDMVMFTLSPFQPSSAWLLVHLNTAVLSPPKVSPSNVWLLVYTLSDQKLDAGKAWGQG